MRAEHQVYAKTMWDLVEVAAAERPTAARPTRQARDGPVVAGRGAVAVVAVVAAEAQPDAAAAVRASMGTRATANELL